MPFLDIDPVAFSLGPIDIRWYALAYVTGILLGWLHLRSLVLRFPVNATPEDAGDFVVWAIAGIIMGGRLGYVLFYDAASLVSNPLSAFALWQGGMSFHGGCIGLALAAWGFCVRRSIPFLQFTDPLACIAPIGLFLGRLANFVNGELWGRPTDLPWGIIFPAAGVDPRHPSQLYEAFLEGIVLFVLLRILITRTGIAERPGATTGIFLLGYGIARTFVELVREPDRHLGFVTGSLTMGMVLSIPMLLLGIFLLARSRRSI